MKHPNNSKLGWFLFIFATTVYILFAYAFGNESICIFKVYAGLPCPGCGMTRAFIALGKGHVQEAFYWHPLWPFVIIGPILYGYFDHVKVHRNKKTPLIWIALILFVGTYAFRMYLYFPHQPPMDFNTHSYFYRIYEFFVK